MLHDVLQRENIMSTGMERGIAIPHAKTEGVKETAVAVGIKRTGADFVSVDGENTRIVILVVSPLKKHTKHIQFLATISAIFKDKKLVDSVVNAKTPAEIMEIFTGRAAFRA